MDRAAVVVGGGTQRVEIHQYELTAGRGGVAGGVAGRVGVDIDRGEPADAVVHARPRHRVVDVHVAVAEEAGVERDAEQPALAVGINGLGEERRGQELPGPLRRGLDDAEAPVLLANEQPPVRRELHRGGVAGQPAHPVVRVGKPRRNGGEEDAAFEAFDRRATAPSCGPCAGGRGGRHRSAPPGVVREGPSATLSLPQ